jgi:hypothetical protein
LRHKCRADFGITFEDFYGCVFDSEVFSLLILFYIVGFDEFPKMIRCQRRGRQVEPPLNFPQLAWTMFKKVQVRLERVTSDFLIA